MIIKCPHCGEICESDSEIAVGQHIECPFCAKKFTYGMDSGSLGSSPNEDRYLGTVAESNKETRFCGHCGTKISATVSFCPNCGQKVLTKEGNGLPQALTKSFKGEGTVGANKQVFPQEEIREEPTPCKIAEILLKVYGYVGVIILILLMVMFGKTVRMRGGSLFLWLALGSLLEGVTFKSAIEIKKGQMWPRYVWVVISALSAISSIYDPVDLILVLFAAAPVILLFQKSSNAWFAICKKLHDAAESGNAESQYNLGMHYLTGHIVAKNQESAVDWLRKAAKQGHENAIKQLQQIGADVG